jgi:hypothetical protein
MVNHLQDLLHTHPWSKGVRSGLQPSTFSFVDRPQIKDQGRPNHPLRLQEIPNSAQMHPRPHHNAMHHRAAGCRRNLHRRVSRT